MTQYCMKQRGALPTLLAPHMDTRHAVPEQLVKQDGL